MPSVTPSSPGSPSSPDEASGDASLPGDGAAPQDISAGEPSGPASDRPADEPSEEIVKRWVNGKASDRPIVARLMDHVDSLSTLPWFVERLPAQEPDMGLSDKDLVSLPADKIEALAKYQDAVGRLKKNEAEARGIDGRTDDRHAEADLHAKHQTFTHRLAWALVGLLVAVFLIGICVLVLVYQGYDIAGQALAELQDLKGSGTLDEATAERLVATMQERLDSTIPATVISGVGTALAGIAAALVAAVQFRRRDQTGSE
jgi:hypothetical protein